MLKPQEAIALSPAAMKAGKEIGEAGKAISAGTSSKSPKGAKITRAEAKIILRECKQALGAIGKLMIELVFAVRS